jgi:hypothetical protein
VARLNVKGKTLHLGCFEDEKAAATAYDQAARSHLGAKAKLNFPEKDGPRPTQKEGSSAGGQKVGLSLTLTEHTVETHGGDCCFACTGMTRFT